MNYKNFINKIVALSFDIDKEYFLNNFITIVIVIVSDNDFKWELNEIDDEIIIILFDIFSSKEVNIEIYYPTICVRAKYKY